MKDGNAVFRTDFSESVEDSQRQMVAGLLMSLNKELPAGAYSIDMDTGVISYVTQIFKTHSKVSKGEVMYHTLMGIEMIGVLERTLDLGSLPKDVPNESQEYGFAKTTETDLMFG